MPAKLEVTSFAFNPGNANASAMTGTTEGSAVATVAPVVNSIGTQPCTPSGARTGSQVWPSPSCAWPITVRMVRSGYGFIRSARRGLRRRYTPSPSVFATTTPPGGGVGAAPGAGVLSAALAGVGGAASLACWAAGVANVIGEPEAAGTFARVERGARALPEQPIRHIARQPTSRAASAPRPREACPPPDLPGIIAVPLSDRRSEPDSFGGRQSA